MDQWINFVKFKNHDKWGFSVITFVFIIVTFTLVFLINLFINKFFYSISFINFLSKIISPDKNLHVWFPEIIQIIIFGSALVWILTVLLPLFYYLIQKISSLSPFSKKLSFSPKQSLSNLVFQGNITATGTNAFYITNSEGVLLKHLYWKDFIIEFNFDFQGLKSSFEYEQIKNEQKNVAYEQKIIKTENNYIGFIFRAIDLDNYFMISIGIKSVLKDNKGKREFVKKLLITPHIRMDGRWEVFTPLEIPDKSLVKNQNVANESGYNKAICKVEGNLLTLEINDKKKEVFKWNLPTNSQANYGERKEQIGFYAYGDASRIRFRNNFGRIGFRAYGDEHVLINIVSIAQL